MVAAAARQGIWVEIAGEKVYTYSINFINEIA